MLVWGGGEERVSQCKDPERRRCLQVREPAGRPVCVCVCVLKGRGRGSETMTLQRKGDGSHQLRTFRLLPGDSEGQGSLMCCSPWVTKSWT